MQNLAFIHKDSLTKRKSKPYGGTTLTLLRHLQKRVITVHKVQQDYMLVVIHEIKSLITRQFW